LRCPYCSGNPVVYDAEFHEWVCPHCGTVLDERVYESQREDVSYQLEHGSWILVPWYKSPLTKTHITPSGSRWA
jgi:Transcription initiation factor TFIIIB, Brf1 subunit/Transcription initiation factor TFIIB